MRVCLDRYAGRYKELRGAATFGDYVGTRGERADEELLTEPLLADIVEKVLGFPKDAYFPQLGRSGLKPDFTPIDLVAHRFVLDAKATGEALGRHEAQIRSYVNQRALDSGVLFNLREVRVFHRGETGSDETLSFSLLPLWKLARGEALPGPELERFLAFAERFAYREMDRSEKIRFVREQPSWSSRLRSGEELIVDVEFLVEKLRLLSAMLAADAAAQTDVLDTRLKLNPGRRRKLIEELELIALDLAPGTGLDQLPAEVEGWRSADGLPARAWRQYHVRVAYLALIRILLYRAWEDVQLVEELLYDGGFGIAYDRLSENVRNVLDDAFRHGRDRYHWLFGPENNYDWYRPRAEALVDVLYSLAPVPLGRLDADVLGTLYEAYAEQIDRDRLGQFFTPRPVIEFMLDRADFVGPDGVFRLEGDERQPRRILDFATGSGGFLVEAARRIIDSGLDLDDRRDLEDALSAIVNGFVGGEISPFPYYLTEVNLLLQVSRLLGRLSLAGSETPPFVLGALHIDTLATKTAGAAQIARLDPHAELAADEHFDLVPLDAEKQQRYRELRGDGQFDLVVGNPPYVTEAGNKILFDRLRRISAWDGIYKGKTDYAYYFLLLAIEKLAPGGRLCVITPAGWMNAGAADFLRERLASELRLDQLFLFGSYRLFAPEGNLRLPTPTVESAILVATKTTTRKDHKLRVVVLEDEVEAPSDRGELLAEMAHRARGKVGRRRGIHVHDVLQADLCVDRPWPVKHHSGDLAARVVSHLDLLAGADDSPIERLDEAWKPFMGIQTCADAYSTKIANGLPAEVRAALEASGLSIGDPIMALPPGSEDESPWVTRRDLLARSPEPEAILYATVDGSDYVNLLRLTRDQPPPTSFIAALERWRPVLSRRAEVVRNERRQWWETIWARDASELGRPKVIALHRTDRGRFALDESGCWKPSGRMCVVVGRRDKAPVAYLCALLNSELLDIWYSVRGRRPRDVWRDYEPRPISAIPYRRPDGDARADQVVGLVRELAANRQALLPHRSAASDLRRTVKDPWKISPVKVDPAALIAALPARETVSVRIDPSLTLTTYSTPTGKPHRAAATKLEFVRAKKVTAVIDGPAARLDLVEELLGGKAPDDLPGLLLPAVLESFERLVSGKAAAVQGLLDEGRRLVEQLERLVCALYEVPAELTEDVIEHAVRRAAAP